MPAALERIDAIILAGGRGTRLASVLPDLPKAMAPVAGRPFLSYVLDHLARSGVVRCVVLALGYRSESIVTYLSGNPPALPVSFVIESEPLGTGGAVLNALSATSGRSVLVLNADSLAAVDLLELRRQHQATAHDATLSLVAVPDAGRYGSVELDGTCVRSFVEKRPGAGLINAGIYLFERAALMGFPPGALSLEHDILPQLVSRHTVGGVVDRGPFLDIGVPESYAAAADFLREFNSLGMRPNPQ